ncbi:hypothetical protein HA402_015543 [Bradysia odoriphaga]|nr:hypothetical protein HA402_015543 [Bradysia odoriphaga]
MDSSSEEYELCKYCEVEIEHEEDKATINSCDCVIHKDCLERSVTEISCYECPVCKTTVCPLDACAKKRKENEKLTAEIKKLKRQIGKLKKQLNTK